MAHLAGFMQLAESEAHEEHGVDAAQHPGQLLLVCLQQQDSFPQFRPLASFSFVFFPCSTMYEQSVYILGCSTRTGSLRASLPAAMGRFLSFSRLPFLFSLLLVLLCMYRFCTLYVACSITTVTLGTQTRCQQPDCLSS